MKPRASASSGRGGAAPRDHREEQEGRRFALGVVFEADFGQNTPMRVLERRLEEEGASAEAADLARQIVGAVARYRDAIDARITSAAPAYPVVQLARIDRALLRSGIGELLHCPTTPARVAISEWVELARTYSGDPARRLMNGVLGTIAREAAPGETPPRSRPTAQPMREPQMEPTDSKGSVE